uniref:V-SNARE coiled-coil homology domain-containing protein n=1 Tax=Petromyzon marinus TaxID=7757 RepID=S4RZ55_PETMA
HADGSLKFWDASAITLQLLYKLRTAKIFERPVAAGVAVRDGGKGGGGVPSPAPAAVAVDEPEDPFAVQLLAWCPESRMLCVAGASSHVVFYRFSRQEAVGEIAVLEVRMQPEPEGAETPDPDAGPGLPASSSQLPYPRGHPSSASTGSGDGAVPSLRVKSEAVRQSPGYQAELVVQLVWADGETSQLPTSLEVSSAYGLVALGTCSGLVVVDVLQRSILLSLSCLDLYGSSDPYQRQPKSPRKSKQLAADNFNMKAVSVNSPPLSTPPYTSTAPPSPLKKESSRCDSRVTKKEHSHCTTACSLFGRSSKRVSTGDHSHPVKFMRRASIGIATSQKAMSAACMEVSAPAAPANGEETRDNSLGQSRSSSVCSIDKESRESVTALRFSESFARKGDGSTCPCLWVGTSLGTVLSVGLSLPPSSEQRLSQPVIISPSGAFSLPSVGGAAQVLGVTVTSSNLSPPPQALPGSGNKSSEAECSVGKNLKNRENSGKKSREISKHSIVLNCLESNVGLLALAVQWLREIHAFTKVTFLEMARIPVTCSAKTCALIFRLSAHQKTRSLPSLRPLLDVNFLPLADLRAARTFCFSNGGQALYLCSPTEIQRITYSQEMCESLQDMLGELFIPVQTPEAPNKGFFKGFFGGNSPSLDREELCRNKVGETGSGRASRSLAQHIPGHGSGSEGVKAAAGGVAAEMSRARLALDERGQRLGDLEDRTAAMLSGAENFSKHAHEMMLKTKDKKWYQL